MSQQLFFRIVLDNILIVIAPYSRATLSIFPLSLGDQAGSFLNGFLGEEKVNQTAGKNRGVGRCKGVCVCVCVCIHAYVCVCVCV